MSIIISTQKWTIQHLLLLTLSSSPFLCLRKAQNTLQLPVFLFSFFSFFCQTYMGLRSYKLVFLILRISQCFRSRLWIQLFRRYPCKNWQKNLYLHFYKTYGYQILQVGKSTRCDSNENNQAGSGDVITSRSRDKLKALYLHYQGVSCHQTWQDGNPTGWAPAHKVIRPFYHVVL